MNLQSENIANSPYQRITREMLQKLQDAQVFFDVHSHVFNYLDVPDGFLGIRLPLSRRFLARMENILHKTIGFTDNDPLSNLAYFIRFFRNKTMKDTAEKLIAYYPSENLVFCALMMDMEPGIMGKIADPYPLQIDKMLQLRDAFPETILPFFAADPNNPELPKNFIKAFDDNLPYRFFGIKIYPSLGYLPSHPVLMDLYKICEEKHIPVTAHCAGATVHTSKKEIKNIPGWHITKDGIFSNEPVNRIFRKKPDYASFFNHPLNWEPVLRTFPGLKLNLAHFGGEDEWKKFSKNQPGNWVADIIRMLEKYHNLYTDFSYTLYNPVYTKSLKVLMDKSETVRSRVLYGSDYYMIVREGHFRTIKTAFFEALGPEYVHLMATENPKKFLFG